LSVFLATSSFLGAQVATSSNATTTGNPEKKPSSTTENADDVLVLSPFEVTAESQHGYLATSTLSGSRLNTKLDEIAASISVVTKQQLEDTGAVDINDIFKNELNTEGTHQYTDLSVSSSGVVTDNTGNNPASANRVRGLTNANVASDGFSTSLPVDSYNLDAVEISRGPNSNIFGLGNAGGSVNLIGSKASSLKSISRFTSRVDSFDGYRETFDLNRPLLSGKLGVRVMGVYDNKGFKLKPSEDLTRRLQTSLVATPFSSTTINARFESYRNSNSRPNSITPRDMNTDWVESGSLTWDPTTLTAHTADGTSLSDKTISGNRLLYYGLNTVDSGFAGVPNLYIDDGKVQLFQIARMPDSTGTGPTNVKGSNYLLQVGNKYTANSGIYPLFNPASITDKSLYDWSSVNLTAPNFQNVKGETTNLSLEQFILRSPTQTLAFQGAWRHEFTSNYDRRFLGVSSTTAIYADINEKLLDGKANPYFLRPFVGGSAPGFTRAMSATDQYRFLMAYDLDLSHSKGWLKWLGRNRFTGLAEYTETLGCSLKYQDTISSTNSWMNGTPSSRNSSGYRAYTRYYVGDANGQNVDYAPQGFGSPPYSTSLNFYNGVTKTWKQEDVVFGEYYSGGQYTRRLLNNYQGNWQGYFLDGRIIPMVGITQAINRTRQGNPAINPTAATDGYYDTTPMTEFGTYSWVRRSGKTKTAGVVVKPFSWLGLTYNQSDSFSPSSTAYDVTGNPLPDPTGETKDYGFDLNFFPGRDGIARLSIRARQYETTASGRGTGDLNTIVQRVIRMDYRSSSGDPGLGTFLYNRLLAINPSWSTDQLYSEINRLSGINMTYTRSHLNATHGDNSDSVSRGQEIEVVVNPSKYWTSRINATRAKPFNGSMSPETLAYIKERWNVWTTAKDPETGELWWTSKADNSTVPQDWYTNNVDSKLKLATALQGKRRAQTREFRVSAVNSYSLAGISNNKFLRNITVGGTVRWESKGALGYYGAAADTVGGVTAIREYDPNRPIWDKEHYYCDMMLRYRLKVFSDRVNCSLQLNVDDVFENGRLQAVAVNPDGQAWAYRIVDPRRFSLTASFDL
jgi:hypothetical protein